jgi:hypothetical protein
MRTAAALILLAALALPAALALRPAPARAEDAPAAPDAGPFGFLVIWRDTRAHSGSVTVNGKTAFLFRGEERGCDTYEAPLAEGANEVRVVFERLPDAAEDESSCLEFHLSPTRDLKDDSRCIESIDSGAAAAQLDFRFAVEGGRPGDAQRTERRWADAARQRLVYEYTGQGPVMEECYTTAMRRAWTDAGVRLYEVHFEGPRVVRGQYFKPDGTLGAEIIGGNGVFRDWFDDGRPAEETPYKDGLPEGMERRWHENGQLAEETPYAAGKAHGAARTWYDDGTLESVSTYRDDLLDGPYEEFYPGGVRHIQGQYAADLAVGTWTWHTEAGEVGWRHEYRDGERVIPPARTYRNEELGFSMRVPEDFVDFLGVPPQKGLVMALVRHDPAADEQPVFLAVNRPGMLMPVLPPGPIPAGFRKGILAGANRGAEAAAELTGKSVAMDSSDIELLRDRWSGHDVLALRFPVTVGGLPCIVHAVNLPTRPEAVQIAVSSHESAADRLEPLLREVLESAEGTVGYDPAPPEGQAAYARARRLGTIVLLAGACVVAPLGIVAVVVFIMLIIRRLRRRAREATRGASDAAPPSVPPGP